jgi:acyl-CoA-binding protein
MSNPALQKAYDKLKTGVMLTNQFRLTFNIPESIQGLFRGNWIDDSITIWIDAPNIPGGELKSTTFNFYGFPFQLPTVNIPTQELRGTVRCDRNLQIRHDLSAWQNFHSSFGNSLGAARSGGKGIPSANATITALDDTMSTAIRSYTLFGLFPANVGDIELRHDEPGVAQFTVSFKYQRWEENAGVLAGAAQEVGKSLASLITGN